jgi:hypothetical protein
MTFSSYSMPLSLACEAEAWEGDVICEDHHAYLKCYYYSLQCQHREGTVRVRPVFLPVKSTSIHCEEDQTSILNLGSWKSFVDRWHQALRHAQGISEVSYALLATIYALRYMPWRRKCDLRTLAGMVQVLTKLFCVYLLPTCQTICLGFLTAKWIWHNRSIDYCPDHLTFVKLSDRRYILCGLAGAWVLVWPVVVPFCLIIVANFLMLYQSFLRPAALNADGSIWHAEDGKVPRTVSSVRLFVAITLEVVLGMSWILIPYGFIVALCACANVAFFGNQLTWAVTRKNQFTYITASKEISTRSYGTMRGLEDSKGDDGEAPPEASSEGEARQSLEYSV